ncbi:hypothetical protein [Sphingosinicella humi]|uniref:Fe-S oxidoreductase n=1 Tax=Allosphingosinicella humi TaxID=2068657 RepID=A0A2U2IZ76_9SPHN|nr:hypothetical protein [Sphingosinicella humi]PWG01390.1 hypothetical protein DF286_14830 [Sphingosinicella humi]
MKTILFAAALSVSGIALAQDTTTDDMTTDQTATDVAPVEQTTPPPADTTAPQPAATTPPPTGTPTTVAPGNQSPERDARGIPVVSDPATAPAGANQPLSAPPGATVVPSANQSAVFSPEPAQQDYPPCTKGVTDNCVQTYERGVRPD